MDPDDRDVVAIFQKESIDDEDQKYLTSNEGRVKLFLTKSIIPDPFLKNSPPSILNLIHDQLKVIEGELTNQNFDFSIMNNILINAEHSNFKMISVSNANIVNKILHADKASMIFHYLSFLEASTGMKFSWCDLSRDQCIRCPSKITYKTNSKFEEDHAESEFTSTLFIHQKKVYCVQCLGKKSDAFLMDVRACLKCNKLVNTLFDECSVCKPDAVELFPAKKISELDLWTSEKNSLQRAMYGAELSQVSKKRPHCSKEIARHIKKLLRQHPKSSFSVAEMISRKRN
jgi:hypothetical protein